MTSEHFTAVSLAFSEHVADLDRARHVFEEEVERFNGYVAQRLEERRGLPGEGVRKLRWGRVEDWSVVRDVAWLNWYAGTRIEVDIRPPGYKVFRRAAAYLYFEVRYSRDAECFRFRCRLENQNRVSADIDEETMAVVHRRGESEFPASEQIKTNTAVLFRKDLHESLFDELSQWIDRSLAVVAEAIDSVFPDARYADDTPHEGTDSEELESGQDVID